MWRLLPLFMAVAGTSVASPPPPARYPDIALDDAHQALVVGTRRAGGWLPQFEACQGTAVICMDPAPFWMHVEVQQVVDGVVAGPGLAVATTSHMGMSGLWTSSSPYLMDLRIAGDQVVMPRYAEARLYQGRDGQWYLPLSAQPLPWLPCSIQTLKQEVPTVRQRRDARIGREYWQARQVEAEPQWFVVSGDHAYPRYWVSMQRLREYLPKAPDRTQRCEHW